MRQAAEHSLPRRAMASLGALTRWDEWYDQKLPFFLAAICYAILIRDGDSEATATQIVALLALFCLYAAFGHLVNDYADREADRKAGKDKLIARLSEPAAIAAVIAPVVGTLAVALASFRWDTVALALAALALAAAYSLPPFRLKTRGIAGLVASALAQRTVPLAIVFQTLHAWGIGPVLMLALASCIGLRFIIIHQLHDRENDQRTGIRTVATEHPPARLAGFVSRVIFPAEIACAGLLAAAISYSSPLFLIIVALYITKSIVIYRLGLRFVILTYGVFSDYYCLVLPVGLTILLAIDVPRFFWLVPLAVAMSWRQIKTRLPLIHRLRAASRAGLAEKPAGAAVLPQSTGAPPHGPPASRDPVDLTLDKADPYPLYARLRTLGAAHNMMWPGLGPTWVIPRYREAQSLLSDRRFISSRPGGLQADTTGPTRGFGRDMVETDPPDHTRLRRLVNKAFTRHGVDRFSGRIEQLAGQLLDDPRRRGSIELMSEYATVIPITIITEILGIPIRNVAAFGEFMYELNFSQTVGRRDDSLEETTQRFTKRLLGLFEQRRDEPRDDLLTALVKAESDGDKLSSDELLGMVYLLLLGGIVTTANIIGNGTLALLRHPDQLELLRTAPELAQSAVEEVMRFDTPVELSSVRFASVDVDLDGQRVPKGSAVRVLIASANRDPAQFSEPDRLDIRRSPCPHLSFGHGIHYCLGAPLARLEGRIALNTLIERSPGLRVGDPQLVKWRPHPVLRGLEQLPLQL